MPNTENTNNKEENKKKNLSDLSTNETILLIVGTFIMSILIYLIYNSEEGNPLYYIKVLFIAMCETENEENFP